MYYIKYYVIKEFLTRYYVKFRFNEAHLLSIILDHRMQATTAFLAPPPVDRRTSNGCTLSYPLSRINNKHHRVSCRKVGSYEISFYQAARHIYNINLSFSLIFHTISCIDELYSITRFFTSNNINNDVISIPCIVTVNCYGLLTFLSTLNPGRQGNIDARCILIKILSIHS